MSISPNLLNNIKKEVEQIKCQSCKRTLLTFDGINSEYTTEGSAVANAFCETCDTQQSVILENIPEFLK